MNERGLSVREIALLLGISTQRVYQQLAAIRREDEQREKTG